MDHSPLKRSRRRPPRSQTLPTGALAVAVSAAMAARTATMVASLRGKGQTGAGTPLPEPVVGPATAVIRQQPAVAKRRRRITGGIAASLLIIIVVAVVVAPALPTDGADASDILALTPPPEVQNARPAPAAAVRPVPAAAVNVDLSNRPSDSDSPAPAPAIPDLDLSSSPTAAPSTVGIPTFVDIPAVGIHASITPLGFGADGIIQVPENPVQAGWFSGGPRPGDSGPAVILGHVDSRTGPAVFFRLKDLEPGDTVTVTSSTGIERFIVDSIAKYAKTDFPTDAVYGPVPDRALRLVTCGGQFDHTKGSYLSNIIVFARAAP
jgi:hypothetical protein